EDPQPAPEPAGGPQPPLDRLGDYQIIREIGRGGMGVVYEAEQVSLGRRVALKVLSQRSLDTRARQRFEREARAAARLPHTNIVPVFGVGEQDGLPYYVMQFIHGRGLDQVLEELRRLQSAERAGAGTPKLVDIDRGTGPRERPGAGLARSLVTGPFAPPAGEAPPWAEGRPAAPVPAEATVDTVAVRRPAAGPPPRAPPPAQAP